MDAGRELDVIVAEKVMGWRIIDRAHAMGAREKSDLMGIQAIPPYSTDIAAAWQVMDLLVEWRFNPTLGLWGFAEELPPMGWYCDLAGYKSFGTTAPHAICNAGLHAFHIVP